MRKIKLLPFPNDNWTRVEIFLRAWDRLPQNKDDIIDQKTLDRFCERFGKGEIKSPTVNLAIVYMEIKRGKVILSKDL